MLHYSMTTENRVAYGSLYFGVDFSLTQLCSLLRLAIGEAGRDFESGLGCNWFIGVLLLIIWKKLVVYLNVEDQWQTQSICSSSHSL